MEKDKQFNENGNLTGFKADLERRVAHIAKVRKVSEQDVWQSMYNISLRKLTLMLDRRKLKD